jgi:hypothetical protein
VPALCALHNFIRVYDPRDIPDDDELGDQNHDGSNGQNASGFGELGKNITRAERNRAERRQDEIAQAMWKSYQAVIRSRQHKK